MRINFYTTKNHYFNLHLFLQKNQHPLNNTKRDVSLVNITTHSNSKKEPCFSNIYTTTKGIQEEFSKNNPTVIVEKQKTQLSVTIITSLFK